MKEFKLYGRLLLIFFFFLFSETLYGQDKNKKKEPLLKVNVRKSGPYFGIQQGLYTVAELGGEMQFKRVKLKQPHTHAINLGASYNLPNNVFGFNAGAYRKPGRFDFFYGVNLAHRTDFSQHRWGGGPLIGYKVFGFQVLTGYNFLFPMDSFRTNNTLYVGLRFVLINKRDANWEWRKRDKK